MDEPKDSFTIYCWNFYDSFDPFKKLYCSSMDTVINEESVDAFFEDWDFAILSEGTITSKAFFVERPERTVRHVGRTVLRTSRSDLYDTCDKETCTHCSGVTFFKNTTELIFGTFKCAMDYINTLRRFRMKETPDMVSLIRSLGLAEH